MHIVRRDIVDQVEPVASRAMGHVPPSSFRNSVYSAAAAS